VNDAFTRLTGYSEREARGRRCDFLVSAMPEDPAIAQLQSGLAERTKRHGHVAEQTTRRHRVLGTLVGERGARQ
jgi:PAS domain-containing protein